MNENWSSENVVQLLDVLDPFYIIVDREGGIQSVGRAFSMHQDTIGQNITEVFKSNYGEDASWFLKMGIGRLTYVKAAWNDGVYKAILQSLNGETAVLLLSPVVNKIHPAELYHLEFDKMPAFNYFEEYIFLSETLQSAINESVTINKKLAEKNKELTSAVKDLESTKSKLVENTSTLENYNIKLESSVKERTSLLLSYVNALRSSEDKLKERQTELENTLQEVKIMQEDLVHREKMALLGQLISSIAHELNTPLAAISASSSALANYFENIIKTAGNEVVLAVWDVVTSWGALRGKDYSYFELEEITRLAKLEFPKVLDIEHVIKNLCQSHCPDVITWIRTENETGKNLLESSRMISQFSVFLTLVESIEVASNKASTIIKSLKSYLHTSSNLEAVEFCLLENLKTVVFLFRPQLKGDRMIEVNVPSNVFLTANQDEMSYVWTNIIGNALYATEGKGRIWIDYDDQSDLGYNTLIISNNGPAIPSAALSRIFEPLYTTKPKGVGTGLGLFIAKRMMDTVQGQLLCTSTEEQTSFHLKIPKPLWAIKL